MNVDNIVQLDQVDYDKLIIKAPDTIYLIVSDSRTINKIYYDIAEKLNLKISEFKDEISFKEFIHKVYPEYLV